MAIELENVLPSEIEKRSFEIITEELTQNGIVLDPEKAPVIKRCKIGRASCRERV